MQRHSGDEGNCQDGADDEDCHTLPRIPFGILNSEGGLFTYASLGALPFALRWLWPVVCPSINFPGSRTTMPPQADRYKYHNSCDNGKRVNGQPTCQIHAFTFNTRVAYS